VPVDDHDGVRHVELPMMAPSIPKDAVSVAHVPIECSIRDCPWRDLLACVCLILALTFSGRALGGETMEAALNFNFYPYLSNVDDDPDFTLNTNIALPAGLSYFSFVNAGGVFHGSSKQFQVSEQNLRWRFSRQIPVDVAVQTLIVRGEGNDNWQIGPRWRLDDTSFLRAFFAAIHTTYNISFFMRFDTVEGSVRQLSHAYQMRFPYLSERLYLSGFFDHNLHRSGPRGRSEAIHIEAQLGARLIGNLYGIAEYRRNDYKAPNKDNLAIGLEYKSRW
jgi:hypothetical protein